jgi:hypothetical protein
MCVAEWVRGFGMGAWEPPNTLLSNAFSQNHRTQQCFCARFYCALLTTCFGPDRWSSSGKMYIKYTKVVVVVVVVVVVPSSGNMYIKYIKVGVVVYFMYVLCTKVGVVAVHKIY